MVDTINVRALVTMQDKKTKLYSFFLNGKDVSRVADISRIEKNNSGELIGYQRGEVQRHVSQITEYLNTNSVVLSMCMM